MSGSVNKVIIVGNLGNKPEIRTMQGGGRVANLSIATSESWKDKTSGERKENTQWHRVVIFNDALVTLAEKYLDKGSKVYIEGQLETRSWEKDGVKQYITEVVLRPYRGELTLLDGKEKSESETRQEKPTQSPPDYDNGGDPIPFTWVLPLMASLSLITSGMI